MIYPSLPLPVPRASEAISGGTSEHVLLMQPFLSGISYTHLLPNELGHILVPVPLSPPFPIGPKTSPPWGSHNALGSLKPGIT